MKNSKFLNLLKILIAVVLIVGIGYLFVQKKDLVGTSTQDTYKGTSMLAPLLLTNTGEKYILDRYEDTIHFGGRDAIKVSGTIVGFANLDRYGSVPKLKISNYHILDTKTEVEGRLALTESNDLGLWYYYVYNPAGKKRERRLTLKGKDASQLQCIVEKLDNGSLGVTSHDLKMKAKGTAYYLPNSLQEIFEISEYELFQWVYGFDPNLAYQACGINSNK